MVHVLQHPQLDTIHGTEVNAEIVQYRSLPYGHISQRFARSIRLDYLPGKKPYDATNVGPQSIQAVNSAHLDAEYNQFPDDVEEQEQSEDCLRVTITVPKGTNPKNRLPVLVFLHGGALALGSGERQYYSPLALCSHALEIGKPLVFVSMNYRLGALGFFHSPEASELIPANNGFHDQIIGFEWIRHYISGFGGDADNVTAIGQSAGGMSLSLHNLSGQQEPLYRRSISFAGTPLTMPDKTPAEHQENFLKQAGRLGIPTESRSSKVIAEDMIECDVAKIRDLGYVGQPCVESEMIPQKQHANMKDIAAGNVSQVSWLESQIISSASYDGSISHIITHRDEQRKDHAKSFVKVVQEVLKQPDELLGIYGIREDMPDEDALYSICQFETDIGFFTAALSHANGTRDKVTTCLQLFEYGNPFDGILEPGKWATHTWDIVSFLGGYEDRLSKTQKHEIRKWRERYIKYIVDGALPWQMMAGGDPMIFVAGKSGGEQPISNVLHGRLGALQKLAKKEGSNGADVLWEDVCRRWLMKGQ